MKIAFVIRSSTKSFTTSFSRLLGIKWYTLVDLRVRWVLFCGLKGKKKKVFIVGLNKTGTSSLGETMKGLGRRHLSYCPIAIEAFNCMNLEKLEAILDGFDSFDDKPWNNPALWPFMVKKYPDALWLYTFRDVSKWTSSYLNYSQQNNAQNEVNFINSLNADKFVAEHNDAARIFEKSYDLSFVWLDCDELSHRGSAQLSIALGRQVKIGHHNRSRIST
jgi:hypothetical protein